MGIFSDKNNNPNTRDNGGVPGGSDLFRGPGLYNSDVESIQSKLDEIKSAVEKSQTNADGETQKLLKLIVNGVLQLKESTDKKFSSLEETIKKQTETPQKILGKIEKLSTKDDLRTVENKILVSMQGVERIITASSDELRGMLATNSSSRPNYPGQNPNQPKTNQKPVDEKVILEKLKARLESEFIIMARQFELSGSKRMTTFWEFRAKDGATEKRLVAGFFRQTNMKGDRSALLEIKAALDKYVDPKSPKYDADAVCLVFTLDPVTNLNLNMIEWIESGIGLMPVEAIHYILPMWQYHNGIASEFFSHKSAIQETVNETKPEIIKEKMETIESEKIETEIADNEIPGEIADQQISDNSDNSSNTETTEEVDKDDQEKNSETDQTEEYETGEDNYRYQAED